MSCDDPDDKEILAGHGDFIDGVEVGNYSLDKSRCDDFSYAMQLSTGMIVRFTSSTLSENGEWLHIRGVRVMEDLLKLWDYGYEPREFSRGMDVRVNQIVWSSDCPEGS